MGSAPDPTPAETPRFCVLLLGPTLSSSLAEDFAAVAERYPDISQ